jgi:transposase
VVEALRRGQTLRAVAAKFGLSKSTAQRWQQRAHGRRLDRVEWKTPRPRPANGTPANLENAILVWRKKLAENRRDYPLGEIGAAAIARRLTPRYGNHTPSIRTITRVLKRHGALDYRVKARYPAPPGGWYLRELAAKRAELDSFDFVNDLALPGGIPVQLFNGVSLWGHVVSSFPLARSIAKNVVEGLIVRWRQHGLPDYAQFDNGREFTGPPLPDVVGQVIWLCWSLGIVPVFAPPYRFGFQSQVEGYNRRWQNAVWRKEFGFATLADGQKQSAKFVAEYLCEPAVPPRSAPFRRPFPAAWQWPLGARPHGNLIFLRYLNDRGEASVLGHSWLVSAAHAHRLVIGETDAENSRLTFHLLRRRAPSERQLLKEFSYRFPERGWTTPTATKTKKRGAETE